MAHFFHINIDVNIDPPPTVGTNLSMNTGPHNLCTYGFNIPVIVANTPDSGAPQPKSIMVIAHFDTGASVTCIDEKIVRELELVPVEVGIMQTAQGSATAKKYLVNISFPNTGLRDYTLNVSDSNLPYNGSATDMGPQNYGVLLGRDIMANWNIVWNGPTSTVLVSD